MKVIKENIYDIRTQDRYRISYSVNNELLKINRKIYKNRLYFFDDYTKLTDRDFMWMMIC